MKVEDWVLRAWYKELKQMFYVLEMNYLTGKVSLVVSTKYDEFKHHDTIHTKCSELEFMRKPCLHDKNDKDIYEGDIITLEGEGSHVWIVVFEDGRFFGHTMNPMGCIDLFFNSVDMNGVEVIGNIYENSKILTGEE